MSMKGSLLDNTGELVKASESINPKERLNSGKVGRPSKPVKRKQKLLWLSKPSLKRIEKQLKQLKKINQSASGSLLVEMALIQLETATPDDLEKLMEQAAGGK